MNEIGLVTINDFFNYGNRLQNYAGYKILSEYGKVENIMTCDNMTRKEKFKYHIWKNFKTIIVKLRKDGYFRWYMFADFNNLIKYSSMNILNEDDIEKINERYDYIFFGSDQIWNPEFCHFYALNPKTDKLKNYALSASIGVNDIEEQYEEMFTEGMGQFNGISVREERGAELVEKYTGLKVPVLIDPTMYVEVSEWRRLERKPIVQIDKDYIFLYFLGQLSERQKKDIDNLSKKYKCTIINMNDTKYYNTIGPSEFLYLIDNAKMVITDSFHGSVFSILFDTSVYILEREDNYSSMNSRIDTLLNKLDMPQLRNSDIPTYSTEHDYSNAYRLLDSEKRLMKSYIDSIIKHK